MAKYFMTPKGIFKEHQDDLFTGILEAKPPFSFHKEYDICETVDDEMEEKLSLKFQRMPISVFQEALEFLRWCRLKHQSEGFVAHRYFAETGTWKNYVPYQATSGTALCYHMELDLSQSSRVAADTHSHPPKDEKGTGASFHSSTDGLDERKNDGLFIVVTGWTPMTCDPDIVGCVEGKKFHLKPEQFFDLSIYNPKPTFPEEWKSRVSSYPCTHCERKRDLDRLSKEISDTSRVYEDEKKYRLIPKKVLDLLRSAPNIELPGKAIMESQKAYERLMSPNWPRMFRCDNHGCGKLQSFLNCTDCKRGVATTKVFEIISDMMDEMYLFTERKEDVATATLIVEESLKKEPVLPDKTAAITPPPHSLPVSASTGDLGRKDERSSSIVVVSTDRKCGNDCIYNAIPHEHAESKSTLEKAWRAMNTEPSAAKVRSVVGCSSRACVESKHIWAICELRKRYFELVVKCPSDFCKEGGHTWDRCEVKAYLISLVKSGIEFSVPEKKSSILEPVVIGDTCVCLPACSMREIPHRHELSDDAKAKASSEMSMYGDGM